MRLVDLLLLIVRVLLIACLALAVAGPFLSIHLPYGDGSIASVTIVLDDSMSMTGRGSPTPFEEARARAREIVESLPPGSEVALVLGGSPARVAQPRTEDLGAAATLLDRLEAPIARGTDLEGALDRAERELAGGRHDERRLVILSDLARHAGLTEAPVMPGVEVVFEPMGEDAPTANAAIVAARAIPDPTTPGEVSIAVELSASADLEERRGELTLVRGGEVIAREDVELGSEGARATLHAGIDPADPAAELVLDIEDAIDADDRRGILLRAPAGTRVLLVDGDPHPVRGNDEARFIARAIDLAPDTGGALRRRTVDPDTFGTMELAEAEVVVLANVPTPSSAVVERLREHVEGGGGLLIAPGANFEARAMVAAFGDLLPARPQPAVSADVAGPVPAGAELVPAGANGLARAQTRRRLTFEDVETSASVPLRFGDGSPALITTQRGDGRVGLFATSLDDAWTDLPFQAGFLPLVAHLMRHLAPHTSTSEAALPPGEAVELRMPAGARQMRITSPRGESFDHEDPDEPLTVQSPDIPGVYRAEIATRTHPLHEEPRLAFVIAPPPAESDLTTIEAPSVDAPTEHASRGTIIRRPLAPWFFLLFGLLVAAEAGLRLRLARK